MPARSEPAHAAHAATGAALRANEEAEPEAATISIDDFTKVDLRIARIVEPSTSRAPTSS